MQKIGNKIVDEYSKEGVERQKEEETREVEALFGD